MQRALKDCFIVMAAKNDDPLHGQLGGLNHKVDFDIMHNNAVKDVRHRVTDKNYTPTFGMAKPMKIPRTPEREKVAKCECEWRGGRLDNSKCTIRQHK
jgi:hypothetical protein